MLLNESIIRKIIKIELLKEQLQLIKEEYDVKTDGSGKWKNDSSFWIKNANKIQAGGINFNKMIKGSNNWRSATTPDYPEFWEAIKNEFGIQNVIVLQAGRKSKISNPKYGRGSSLSGKSAVKAATEAGINTLYQPSSDSDNPPYVFNVGNSKGNPKLSEENFKKIESMLDNGNTIIHCQHGADRTGAIVGRYYVEKGMDAVDALNDAYKYKSGGKSGFHKSVAKYILTAGIKKALRENDPESAQKYLDELKSFNKYFKEDVQVKEAEKQIAKAKELSAQGSDGKAKALLSTFEKKYEDIVQRSKEIKSKIMDAGMEKAYDSAIKNMKDSNNFRKWVNDNKEKSEVAKILKDNGIKDTVFDSKITKEKYARNKSVYAIFYEYGLEYIGTEFFKNIKKNISNSKKSERTQPLESNKPDLNKIEISNIPNPSATEYGINEPYLKGSIGDKSNKYSIGVGTETGDIYIRKFGSKTKYQKLNESIKVKSFLFENTSPELLSLRDVFKSFKISGVDLKIQKSLKGKALDNFSEKMKKNKNPYDGKKYENINIDLLAKKTRGTDSSRVKAAVEDAIRLYEETGVDPGYIFGTTIQESGKHGSNAAAFNYWMIFNKNLWDIWKNSMKLCSKVSPNPPDNNQIIEAKKLYDKGGWGAKNNKTGEVEYEKSYFGEQNKGYRNIIKYMEISPLTALGVAYGKFQVLGFFLVEAFNNDPEKMWNTFLSSPDDPRFNEEAFRVWFESSYSKNVNKGSQIITDSDWRKLVSNGDYKEAVRYYFGNYNKSYSDNVTMHSRNFHKAAGTNCPTVKNIKTKYT